MQKKTAEELREGLDVGELIKKAREEAGVRFAPSKKPHSSILNKIFKVKQLIWDEALDYFASLLPNTEQKVQGSDTTDDDSSNEVGTKKDNQRICEYCGYEQPNHEERCINKWPEKG